jgi:hypothetical protein
MSETYPEQPTEDRDNGPAVPDEPGAEQAQEGVQASFE